MGCSLNSIKGALNGIVQAVTTGLLSGILELI